MFGDFEPEPGSAKPSGQYIVPTCSITDDGSGVDPASIVAWLNGTPAPVTFDIASGVATLRGTVATDGSHMVKVTASDFRGNEASAEWSFLADASVLPEPAQGVPGQSQMQRRPTGR